MAPLAQASKRRPQTTGNESRVAPRLTSTDGSQGRPKTNIRGNRQAPADIECGTGSSCRKLSDNIRSKQRRSPPAMAKPPLLDGVRMPKLLVSRVLDRLRLVHHPEGTALQHVGRPTAARRVAGELHVARQRLRNAHVRRRGARHRSRRDCGARTMLCPRAEQEIGGTGGLGEVWAAPPLSQIGYGAETLLLLARGRLKAQDHALCRRIAAATRPAHHGQPRAHRPSPPFAPGRLRQPVAPQNAALLGATPQSPKGARGYMLSVSAAAEHSA